MPTTEIFKNRPDELHLTYEAPSLLRDKFVDILLEQEGKPYILYGMGPEGFDCSGLISYALDQIGILRGDIRRCGDYFYRFGKNILQEFPQKGDLPFFSKRGVLPTHMGAMVSEDKYIHAQLKAGKVIISQLEYTEIVPWPKTQSRQQYFRNPIGFIRLFPLSETEK